MKIFTSYIFPPIPPREYDWSAMFDCDDGDSGRVGFGRTEQEAARDLLDTYFEDLAEIAVREFERYAGDMFDAPLAEKVKQFAAIKATMALLKIANTKDTGIPAELIV